MYVLLAFKLLTQLFFIKQITMAANKVTKFMGSFKTSQDNDSNSIETVIILEESERFTEKLLPLVLSKLPYEKSQLVHLLTFFNDKTRVVQKLQSLLRTLDADKRIQVLVLTYEKDPGRIDNFAESLIRFLSGTTFPCDVQIVRLASECRQTFRINNTTTIYKLFAIDSSESNEFIATRVAGLLHSDSFPLHKQLRMDKQIYSIQSHSTAMLTECTGDIGVGDKQSEDLHILDYVYGRGVKFRPAEQGIQMKRHCRTRSDRTYDVFEANIFIIISFFSLFLLFHLCYYGYVILTYPLR